MKPERKKFLRLQHQSSQVNAIALSPSVAGENIITQLLQIICLFRTLKKQKAVPHR
ncbi:MAG: hypothetical protein IJ192_04045 [Clostridia bacterium]|nr:hypothetical protein [Clostridia bacterium]